MCINQPEMRSFVYEQIDELHLNHIFSFLFFSARCIPMSHLQCQFHDGLHAHPNGLSDSSRGGVPNHPPTSLGHVVNVKSFSHCSLPNKLELLFVVFVSTWFNLKYLNVLKFLFNRIFLRGFQQQEFSWERIHLWFTNPYQSGQLDGWPLGA